MKPLDKIVYLKAELLLTSALVIGGDSEDTADLTPLRDYDGIPFIPGTSLAGAVRDYALKVVHDESLVDNLFGYTKKNGALVESFHSKVVFHDCYPINDILTVTRDMVALDEKTKTAKPHSKFDVELVPRGSKFDFRIELISYKGDDSRLEDCFLSLLKAMENENIRLGAKRRRGWGKFKLEALKFEKLELTKPEDLKRWIDFSWDTIKADDQCLSAATTLGLGNIVWKIPFTIPGALLIRSYQDFSKDDAVMFKENGMPVIPATSFTGCLRKACFDILYYDLRLLNPELVLDQIFGYVHETDKTSKASRLFIEDIELTFCNDASYTRNKINRFTGGAEDSALFTNRPIYNSTGTIVIEFNAGMEDWVKQLLYCALMDIGTGIVALGGETSIGRGIMYIDSNHIPRLNTGAEALCTYLTDKPRREAAQ